MEGTDWQLVQSKSAKKKQKAERGKSQPNASRSFQESARVGAKSSRRAAALKKRVIAASRMPELPSTHCKIIVRPRGGLDLRKTSCYGISTAIFNAAGITAPQASTDLVCTNVVQNIVVVCTEKEDNARKILALKNIRVNGKEHEVAVYAAAEGNYVKGVVRNVERDIGDAELARLIVHRGNPSVRGVKRIKETGSVVVLFDAEEVPSYIRVGQAIVRCYLFKKQIEVCTKCTRVGHRADVCPTPMVNVCRNCGAKDPKQEHSCHVRCKLCGKGHPTGDKACQQKYQTPFVVRQRRNNEKWNVPSKWTCRISQRSRPGSLGRLLAAGCSLSSWEADPRLPPLRNGPPKKRIQNLLEHQLDPLPRSKISTLFKKYFKAIIAVCMNLSQATHAWNAGRVVGDCLSPSYKPVHFRVHYAIHGTRALSTVSTWPSDFNTCANQSVRVTISSPAFLSSTPLYFPSSPPTTAALITNQGI
ncbi:hypothetical protein HPB49_001333 [Dermacentor silvarum]|uniref:Uncharacterized protein n=1 Tax=Dermacentor silvarum TaxID=543639 RepID=A0ACB8D9V5_DERSI|nr:hypothetical protein HPB49_001333 [Dermacentor silvarum]